jgi:hypothetical protein
MSRERMFSFETATFLVEAFISPDQDLDLSFDDSGETAEKLESGEYQAFATDVTVTHKPTGIVLATESLCGSVYSDPREFFTDHRNSPAEHRNTLANKARGVCICHYFPGMVTEATKAARAALASLKVAA